ncbi:MAG: hypothetical protein E7634_06575 [Ruminococcaceae bacterium]|nr:hypothetical protein [Oscillospiraceae bacterium]MBQ9691635.1 hypothetical protein [Clostridia bacterium]
MNKIIVDSFVKDFSLTADKFFTEVFVNRVTAVNAAYGYLYEKGILKKVSFEYLEFDGCVMFALDTDKLLPYREEMEASGVQGMDTACSHIFDQEYTPCLYSGAVELTWTMSTYREFDGTTERSWEIEPCRHMESHQVLDVLDIRQKQGVCEAVKYIFKLLREKKI